VGIPDAPDTIEGSADSESMVRSAATLISAFAITGVAHSVVPARTAGGGAGRASGVAVSGIRYELGPGDSVAAIGFAVSPQTVSLVRARLSASGAWSDCARSGTRWRCAFDDVSLGDVEALAVAAASA
jgi:hypothetical protein